MRSPAVPSPLSSIERDKRFVNSVRNEWAPKSKVIIIRSQQGQPVTIYTGDDVAVESTDIPKSTKLLVDGKLLIVYRTDYTIYDTDALAG